MLAKRLINQISTSDDDEELIISKLKVNYSFYIFVFKIFLYRKHVDVIIHQNLNECCKIYILVEI